MCDWLLCGEWCDAQLVCAGRTFNVHRAVLASVSEFLRNILLSCPQEEMPVIIVLPDFELDAMSSVLYYIYNGEVLVEKNKLLSFLDIVKTLKIFIDYEYLKMVRDSVVSKYLDLLPQSKNKFTQNIFTLTSENNDEHEYVNVRKRERFQDIRLQFSQIYSDVDDKGSSCCSRSDIPLSLDSQTPYGDRQRNCFLRDLYIETNPQNGNVNGLRGGVLPIPNEYYRLPTSVLLTNANGKLPNNADDILSKTSEEISDHRPFVFNISRTQQDVEEYQLDKETFTKNMSPNINWKRYDLSNRRIFVDKNYLSVNSKTPVITCNNHRPSQLLLEEISRTQLIHSSSLDLRITQSFSDSVFPTTYDDAFKHSKAINLFKNNINNARKYITKEKNYNLIKNRLKTPIFNQVIESPWRPRLPSTYKPFRRKDFNEFNTATRYKEENLEVLMNDSNNNIKELTIVASQCENNESTCTEEEFTCTICSQVFTSEEILSSHMKRHTTAPRYSCADCGKTFSQLRNFKYHMSVHRGTREFAATCTVCGKYFNDRGYLSSHMKIHRNRKEYKCSVCPKSFNQRVAYNMHIRIHTGVKPHVCEECGKAFSRKMLLKQHQRTHSGERPYACPHCDKRFADRSNMTLHLRLHTGVKPFSCSLCPKSFTKKHHLKSHLNFHTGAKPYSCPRCHLAFTQSSNMRTHLKKCNAPELNAPAP